MRTPVKNSKYANYDTNRGSVLNLGNEDEYYHPVGIESNPCSSRYQLI
jgi:hypothetical protein